MVFQKPKRCLVGKHGRVTDIHTTHAASQFAEFRLGTNLASCNLVHQLLLTLFGCLGKHCADPKPSTLAHHDLAQSSPAASASSALWRSSWPCDSYHRGSYQSTKDRAVIASYHHLRPLFTTCANKTRLTAGPSRLQLGPGASPRSLRGHSGSSPSQTNLRRLCPYAKGSSQMGTILTSR